MLSSRLASIAIGIGLLAAGSSAYSPFADVEELGPKTLGQFCDPAVKTGIRHCEGTTKRNLEDGGIVELKWGMHVDPDRILSLDTEQQHGIKIIKCTPSSLELMLPPSHAHHAREGDLIVASHFVHGCEHLMQVADQEKLEDEPMNYNLYHRVVKVSSLKWLNADGSDAAGSTEGKFAHAKLWTREMASLGHAVGSIQYAFDYTPVEAVDPSPFPQRRTEDGDYYRGRWADDAELSARRLNAQNLHPETYNAADFASPQDNYHDYTKPNGDVKYRVDGGHPTMGGETVTTDDVKSLLNFQPKKVANFGWNWNFQLNASQDISFNYTVPGSLLYVMIQKPYIKAHSKLQIKFRSYMPNENAEDTFFTDNTWVSLSKHTSDSSSSVFEQWEPRVKWEVSMNGHGSLKGGLLAQMNAQQSISSNPLELIQIPVLQQFWKPKWFGTLDFNLGNLPVSVTPGIQFKAKFFHYGSFRGSLAMGLETHPEFHPKLQFDSFTGLRVDLRTKLKQTTVTPPNWLVSTNHFECGLALEPTIWIKGHMGNTVHNTKIAAALRPYFNMTITRAGHVDAPADFQKELIVYPFRVVGLDVNAKKRYKVRISTEMPASHCKTNSLRTASGPQAAYSGVGNAMPDCEQYRRRIDTSEALNWGEVEFNDPVSRFSFGLIAQRMLLFLNINVQIIEVDYTSGTPFERASEKQQIKCQSLINGVCQPSPMIKEFWFGSASTKVKLYAHAVWKENPRSWFATRIRGVATSFPEVIVNQDYMQQVDPGFKIDSFVNSGTISGANANKPLILVLRHAFKSYPVTLNKQNGYVPGMNSSSLTTDQIIEVGSSFLSTWDRTCLESSHGCDPKLILYHGDIELASADIPRIPWNTRKALTGYQAVFGNEAAAARIVPVSVALKPTYQRPEGATAATTKSYQYVGLVRMKFAIASPASWNRWIAPYEFTPVQQGSAYKLVWTLSGADPYKATSFNLMVLKCDPKSATAAAVGATTATQNLQPRVGNSWCSQVSSEPALSIKPTMQNEGVRAVNRFEHDIQLNGMSVGQTIMVAVQWVDDFKNSHTMYAPPFLIEGQPTAAVAAATPAVAATPVASPLIASVAPTAAPIAAATAAPTSPPVAPQRKLAFPDFGKMFGVDQNAGWKKGTDGQWVSKYHSNTGEFNADRECKRKDLNFAFGTGIMFRAYVQHLSLPKDLPVLGAIQNAPDLGMPWTNIATWRSTPKDLASMLPALLCRHGVCAATLPGCPSYNSVKHYYPEITLQFKHTLRYPHTADQKKDQAQWMEALKAGLAYTFAVMPEAIQILMHYTNHTKLPNVLTPISPATAHRRRYQQYHNVMTGDDACENRGYTTLQCSTVGCCQWNGACHSAVGTGPCYTSAAVNPTFSLPGTAAPGAVAVGVTVGPPAAVVAAPVAPVVAAPVAPVVAAPVAPVATGPTVAPGPVITPLTGRRLKEEETQTEARVHSITVQFKHGLRYKMDRLLMNAMRKEGLFQQLEEVHTDSADKPVRIHSYTIRDLKSKSESEKWNSLKEEVFESPQSTVVVAGLAGCALMGVAFVVMKARASYNQANAGPVE